MRTLLLVGDEGGLVDAYEDAARAAGGVLEEHRTADRYVRDPRDARRRRRGRGGPAPPAPEQPDLSDGEGQAHRHQELHELASRHPLRLRPVDRKVAPPVRLFVRAMPLAIAWRHPDGSST